MAEIFWMDGVMATHAIETRSDLAKVDDGNFWALSISYEGHITATSFSNVTKSSFPDSSWTPIESNWRSSHSKSEYCNYVNEIRNHIAEGYVYQANACRVLSTPCDRSLEPLMTEILKRNPAPYAAYFRNHDVEIASASPELFLKREGERILTSPIKGTRKLSSPNFGVKDNSENIMIVDLMRNDFGTICTEVSTPHLLREEEHPGLVHLVSDVQGILRQGVAWSEIFECLLPAGSISGAPKSSAREIIARYEKYRGPYCGVLGWIHGDQALLSVAIRIFWRENGALYFGTGAGITWGSEPESEWDETVLKASRLISIAGGVVPGGEE